MLLCAVLGNLPGCSERVPETPRLRWYVFDEPSGAFAQAAQRCTGSAQGRYRIELAPLPTDADQQREQLVRRLAAGDPDIDIIGMDVIWTAEFAAAGWVLPWPDAAAQRARAGRNCGRLPLPRTPSCSGTVPTVSQRRPRPGTS
jgi:multiple sugar transport system substrate-binding protein